MTIKPRVIVVIIIAVTLAGGILGEVENRLWAQEKEKLLFQEIPIVITASRKAQPLTEAPTTITVINSDDIRYSGATNVPDVLRSVAGVDVMTISARDQQVGVRGFITPLNNKLLVLVDGRTMYTDLYGTVLWDSFPVGLEEIDRIEVIKSPASSIYGANAFSGVINIITRTPEQLQGTTLHFTVGNHKAFTGSLLHAGKIRGEKIKYKVSAQWDQTRDLDNSGGQKAGIFRANALVAYSLGKKGKVVFSAGRAYTKDRKLLSGEYIGTGVVDYKNDYLQLDVEYGSLKFRTFYKKEDPTVDWLISGEYQDWNIATLNSEILHTFSLGKKHSLVWGLNYRYNTLKKNPFIARDHHQNLWALFLEDEIKISSRFHLTLGGRYDEHPLVAGHFSPRVNIMYSPSKGHILRLSYAQAYRNPSFVESYLYIRRQLAFTLPPPLPPMEVPYIYFFQGNPDLKPEAITSFEIGYHSNWSHHLSLEVNLFYNRYNNFFSPSRMETYYGENEIFPGSPGGIFPKYILASFENKFDARGMGGEISLDFLLNDTISGFINYSYLAIKNDADDPATVNIDEKDRIRPENPKNKINAGLRFLFKKGISLNLQAHWVEGVQKLVRDVNGISTLNPVPGYFIVSTRAGYTFWKKKAEIAVALLNLFNKEHFQYPTPENMPLPNSEQIGRQITLILRLKF